MAKKTAKQKKQSSAKFKSEQNPFVGGYERLGGKKLVQHGADNFQRLQKQKHGASGSPRRSG